MKVRRLGREIALGALYQVDVIGTELPLALRHAISLLSSEPDADQADRPRGGRRYSRHNPLAERTEEARDFATALAGAALQHIGELDEIIGRFAEGWTLSRMASVDRNILRLALAEIIYFPDIPVSVSIDEAVSLAKDYSTEESGKFVNGILGSYAREVEGKEE